MDIQMNIGDFYFICQQLCSFCLSFIFLDSVVSFSFIEKSPNSDRISIL